MTKVKNKVCDGCRTIPYDNELKNSCLYRSRDVIFKGLIYSIPDIHFLRPIMWRILFKRIPQKLCEECYIMNRDGLYAVACPDCVSIIYLRYEDWTDHNRRMQDIPDDVQSITLNDDGLNCPYCGGRLLDLLELRGRERKDVRAHKIIRRSD
jgi:DNA-directed RNA polymerase subunit RPC12/RpoP